MQNRRMGMTRKTMTSQQGGMGRYPGKQLSSYRHIRVASRFPMSKSCRKAVEKAVDLTKKL